VKVSARCERASLPRERREEKSEREKGAACPAAQVGRQVGRACGGVAGRWWAKCVWQGVVWWRAACGRWQWWGGVGRRPCGVWGRGVKLHEIRRRGRVGSRLSVYSEKKAEGRVERRKGGP